jgi:PAS domain S-box-containing protein
MAISFQGFRSLIENNPDAISLIDEHGEILYGSASSAKIFGYQPDGFVGRNSLDLPGCGLGLAVCKKIIEELGGTMWIESNGAEGAAFCFTIRAQDADTGPPVSRGELV